MLQFLRCLLAIYAIATMSFVWAGCPEGQKQNDRTGECALIPGWTGADQSAKEKAHVTRVVVVRHAEKAGNSGDAATPLSAEGERRAEVLSKILGVSGITAVFSTKTSQGTTFLRTLETINNYADSKGINVKKYSSPTEVVQLIKSAHAGESVLVAGHSTTVPKILSKLGVESVPDIDNEFDNLFVVMLRPGAKASMMHLKYGDQNPSTTKLVPASSSSTAENKQSLAAGQTGRISFFSPPFMGLRQFLEGGPVGPPIKVHGYLAFPSSGTERVPAVILLHGGKGISHHCRADRDCSVFIWAEKMRHIGLATLVIDSNEFRCRGRKKCYNLNEGLPNMIDAYRAMALLSTHPRIDPARIALMGFSVGGIATLYATVKRFQRMWAPEGQEPAAYVSFYPACNYTWDEEELVTDRPVRILMGDKDQIGYYVPCVDYVNRLRKAGKDFKITIYPGIHHSFDNDIKRGSKWSIGPHPTYCLWREEKGIGMVQVAEESDAFYAGCASLLPNRLRECRYASMSDQMRPHLANVLQLRASDKQDEQAQTASDSSTSGQTSSSAPVDPQLDKAFAEFVTQYVSEYWQGWDPGKKIGDCLATNAAAMTTGAKKGVMEHGLDEAFEKLSDSDAASFDEVYALCEKGGSQEQVTVQSESDLDKAFAEFVTQYVSEYWQGWDPGKKIGDCLATNAAAMTTGAKKGVMEHGLDEAFEKLSDSDATSFDEVYALCEKGGSQEQVTVQSESALDKAFAKFVTGYISENWGTWAPGEKVGQCLGENAASITEQAKKDVMQYGLEKAFEELSGPDRDSLGGIYASCQAAYRDEGGQAKAEYDWALEAFEMNVVEGAKYFEGQEALMSDISCEVAKSRVRYDRKTHYKAIREVAEFFRTTFNL